LYHLAEDRFEQNDLATEFPEKVEALSKRWFEMAESTDFLPEKKRVPVRDVPASNTHHEWHKPELTSHWQSY
jgi:hypothetical protein